VGGAVGSWVGGLVGRWVDVGGREEFRFRVISCAALVFRHVACGSFAPMA
jgi:hypothetical protein